MRVGIVQLDMVWRQKEKNMEKCEIYFKKAKEEGVDLLAFPEMTLTGFSISRADIAEQVEERGGEKSSKTIDFFKEMTIKYKVAAIFGFSQKREGKKLANKMILMENGKIRYEYQKIHPFNFAKEGEWYEGGNFVSVTKIGEHFISGFICYDLRFPAIFQIVSMKAECIFVIANWPEERQEQWLALLKARAIENQCYIVGVNRVGEGGRAKYSGKSVIFNAAGEEMLGPLEGEGLFYADLDFEWQRNYKKNFPTYLDRRDDLYSQLHIDSENATIK